MKFYTNNYEIRSLTLEDTEKFYELAHDELVKKYVPYSYCESLEDAKENMEYYKDGDCKNDFYLAICKGENIIGIIIANRMTENYLEPCVFVSKKCRGKGVITEAMKGFIQWLKENTEYEIINLIIEKDNIASNCSALKLNSKLYNEDGKRNFYHIFIR